MFCFRANLIFVLFNLLFFSLNGFSAESSSSEVQIETAKDWQEELKLIDTEIKQLEDLKTRYNASAARNQDNALRWQFNQKQEAKRASKQADLDRQMVEQIQKRLDYLESKKAQILKDNPEAARS